MVYKKLTIDLDHIYLNQQVESNPNSEYGPDDDLDADLQVYKYYLF